MKALKDWTLEEIQNECKEHNTWCDNCKIDTFCTYYFNYGEYMPSMWDITAKRKPKETTIVWHKYPEDKPAKDKYYLTYNKDDKYIQYATAYYRNIFRSMGKDTDKFVKAWAELPEVPNWDGD